MDIPEFGIKESGKIYRDRPGAYAIIRDYEDRIALIVGHGKYFLPGGGLEKCETVPQALHREIMEECGWEVIASQYLGEAIQYIFAHDEGYYKLHNSFFVVDCGVIDKILPRNVIWATSSEATSMIHRDCDIWAISLLSK